MDSQDPKNGDSRSFQPPPRPQEIGKESKPAPTPTNSDEDTANSLFKVLQLIKKHKKTRTQKSLEKSIESDRSVTKLSGETHESDWMQPKFLIALALFGIMCAAIVGIYRVLQKTPTALNSTVLVPPTPSAVPPETHPSFSNIEAVKSPVPHAPATITRPPVIGPKKLPLPPEISRPTTPIAEDAVSPDSADNPSPHASPPAVLGGDPLDPDLVVDEPQTPGEHVTPLDPAQQAKPAQNAE